MRNETPRSACKDGLARGFTTSYVEPTALRLSINRLPRNFKASIWPHQAPRPPVLKNGSALFVRSVRQRLIGVDGANVHPALEKRSPIGSRIDVAVWRQAVAVAVIKMQGVETIAVSVWIDSRFRWFGNSCSQDENRKDDQSHRSHRGSPEASLVSNSRYQV
jgi:hypothetical protein